MNKITIGIDPDLNGGIVGIDENNKPYFVNMIPSVQNQIDAIRLNDQVSAIKEMRNECDIKFKIFIEQPIGPSHRKGIQKQLDNYGLIRGLLIAHGLTGFIEVPPRTWQEDIFDLADIRQRIGKNISQFQKKRKQLKLEIGQRIIKQELGFETDHPGIIDAALIALWGRGKS